MTRLVLVERVTPTVISDEEAAERLKVAREAKAAGKNVTEVLGAKAPWTRWQPGQKVGSFTLVRGCTTEHGNRMWVATCECGRECRIHPSTAVKRNAKCRECRSAARVKPRRCSSCDTTDENDFGASTTRCARCDRQYHRRGACPCGRVLWVTKPCLCGKPAVGKKRRTRLVNATASASGVGRQHAKPENVQKAIALRAEGKTMREIGQALGCDVGTASRLSRGLGQGGGSAQRARRMKLKPGFVAVGVRALESAPVESIAPEPVKRFPLLDRLAALEKRVADLEAALGVSS